MGLNTSPINSQGVAFGGGIFGVQDATQGMSVQQQQIMLNNWMTGGKPDPVDPTVTLAKTEHLSGAYQLAASGSGYGGAFGGSKGGLNFLSPRQPGIPSVPTMPGPGSR